MDSSGIHLRLAAAGATGDRSPADRAGRTAPAGPASAGKTLPAGGQNRPPAPAPTHDQVQQAAQQIQSYLNDSRREFQIQVDDDSGRTVVRVINPVTHELIRQIPSEEALTLSRALSAGGGRLVSDLA